MVLKLLLGVLHLFDIVSVNAVVKKGEQCSVRSSVSLFNVKETDIVIGKPSFNLIFPLLKN